MPKSPLSCTENVCEFGHNLKALQEKNDLHFKDYHKKSVAITEVLYTIEFTRTQEWKFLCECGGMFNPARSFTRHVKECKDINMRISEAVDEREDVATESYVIKPTVEKQAKVHDGATITTKLLKDIVTQLQSNSHEDRDRASRLEALFSHHNDILQTVVERQDEATKEIQKLKEENVEITQTVRHLGNSITHLERRVYTEPEPQWTRRRAENPPPQSRGQVIRRFLSAEPSSSECNGRVEVEKQDDDYGP
ncbi:hypothetical protein BGX26_008057, partial [Mortierella sp. AD094]